MEIVRPRCAVVTVESSCDVGSISGWRWRLYKPSPVGNGLSDGARPLHEPVAPKMKGSKDRRSGHLVVLRAKIM